MLAQLNFHADCVKTEVQAPQLPALAGKALEVQVRAGMAGMSGHAVLDGTQLDEPRCSVSYTDMSPAPASAAAAAPAPALRAPMLSPFCAAPDPPGESQTMQGSPKYQGFSSCCIAWSSCDAFCCTAGLKPSISAGVLQSSSASGPSPASTLEPPEASSLSSAASMPHADSQHAGRAACLPHTVSEENLSSLDASAGERMKYALQRLAL